MKIQRICFAMSFVILTSRSSPLPAAPPNVLFIAVDDLRPQLGCYDYPGMITPNVDELASRGMVFNRAYCQAAVCRASRVSLLLGLRPDTTEVWSNGSRHRHFRNHLPDIITLPQHFKNHGCLQPVPARLVHRPFDSHRSLSIHSMDAHQETDRGRGSGVVPPSNRSSRKHQRRRPPGKRRVDQAAFDAARCRLARSISGRS